jgi:hypothetical protein
MPYLDADWNRNVDGPPDIFQAHLWVPERDWEGWKHRGLGLSLRDMWERDRAVAPSELDHLSSLSHENREAYLGVLGKDLGSIQRDCLYYMNWVEQLKQSHDDTTADKVVETMQEFGFISAEWPPDAGGPPLQASPRPWRGVLNWLMANLAKAGKIILKIADFLIGTLVGGPGVSAVAVGAFPPSLGVEISTDLFRDRPAWVAVHRFLENVQNEIASKV